MRNPVRSAPARGLPIVAFLLLAGCSVVPPVAPPPPPPPAPAAPSPPPPAPAVSTLPWEEAPVAAGDWTYRQAGADSSATFGIQGGAPLLTLRCVAATRQITLARAGAAGASAMTIRTTYGALQWASGATGDAGGSVTRAGSDPGFDWIAFSRGRISVEAIGASRLIVPAWAEIVRVIEDCRN